MKKVEVKGDGRYARLAAKAAAGITTARRKFRPSSDHTRSNVYLIRVISITPGGTHAWCDSDQGPIRKPISSIPKRLVEGYRAAEGGSI